MNYFKILEGLTKLVKSGQIKSIDEALAMLQRGGAKIDGILRQGVINIFKKGKARDPDFGTNVTKMPVDDAGVPFNPNTLKSTTEKRGVENLFKKKADLPEGVDYKNTPLPVNPKVENFYDELVENAYNESKKTGRDVKTIIEETINYKFTGNETGKEILDIIEKKFFKADGGRIGFRRGGRGRQDPMGGHAHQTAQEMREAAPDQFGGGMNISHGGGGNNKPSIPPVIKDIGKNAAVNFGIKQLGLSTILPQAMMMKGIYDRFKAPTDEDLILGNDPFAGIEDYRADLSKGQMKALDNPTHKFNIQEMGDYGILDDAGFKAQEIEGAPATKEDIDSYYAGTYVGADGGRVGYDIGGLTGQAKNIYDSWIDAGHSEEDVLAYLESRGLYNAPVIQEGIMTAPNIINQNLGGNGNDGGTTINRYDPNQNLGPNKDITDYEADAYGIGPTWSGQFARLKNAFSKIPTPFNIARMGIQKARDWADQKRIEKEAAEAKAAEALQAQITAQANQTARDLVDRGAPSDWGKTETRDSSGWESSPFKKGGLATMFTRRR